jgi:hypothetical protein
LKDAVTRLSNWILANDKATLALALGVRLILAPFTGHPYDLPIWFETGNRVATLKSPYDVSVPIGYLGIWPLWLGVSSAAASLILGGNTYLYTFLIKLPIIAADFVIPGLLVKLLDTIRQGSPLQSSTALRISRSYLLNPFVIIAGSVWAMPDNMIAVGILLALLTITSAKSAGVFMALSALIKPYPVVLLPAFLGYLKEKALKFILPLFAIAGIGFVSPLILFHVNPSRILGIVVEQTSRFPNGISPAAISLNLNSLYPEIFTTRSILESLVLPWPVRYLWLEILAILTVLIILAPRPLTISKLVAWMRIFAASYYLLFAAVSEQTLIPFAVLCMIDADSTGRYGIRSTYWMLTAVVTAFITLNVPIWRFLYPTINITVTGTTWNFFQACGLIVLHILFVIVVLRDARVSWRIARQI